MTRAAMVVQRYGEEVNGGAEYLCRSLAERLKDKIEVEVATTCAIDYITWRDEYPEGESLVRGVRVHRFPVDAPRDINRFNRLSDKIFTSDHNSEEEEEEWMRLQGPYSTSLLEWIESNAGGYDLFIFFTYLYCTSYFGLPLVKGKAILVPTAHDEPPIHLSMFRKLFKMPVGMMFCSPEERAFIHHMFQVEGMTEEVAGIGIEEPAPPEGSLFREKHSLSRPFILYVGRLDPSKGCGELLDHFIKYKGRRRNDLKLVLVGRSFMELPDHPDVIPLGFVTEEEKFSALQEAKLLVLPSIYESLSISLLEAFSMGTPALVNGRCSVLKGHCLRSNAGLYYGDYAEFEACLDLLTEREKLWKGLGANGLRYVRSHYNWESIQKKYLDLIERVELKLRGETGGEGDGAHHASPRRGEIW